MANILITALLVVVTLLGTFSYGYRHGSARYSAASAAAASTVQQAEAAASAAHGVAVAAAASSTATAVRYRDRVVTQYRTEIVRVPSGTCRLNTATVDALNAIVLPDSAASEVP